MSRTHVIIPSWGRLPPEMEAETGCRYAAFIPLGGKPLYRHLLARHGQDHGQARFVFVLAEEAPELEVGPDESVEVQCVRLSRSASIGETVLAGLADVQVGDAVVVHMADTLLDLGSPASMDAVYVQQRSDLYRWTSVMEEAAGCIRIPHDRDATDLSTAQAVCVGLFTFAQGHRLKSALAEAVGQGQVGKEPFFTALESYSAGIPMTLVEPLQWFDCGHVDTYYESRLGYQNLRHFNTLSYEPLKGQVTKRSEASEAFRHQVRWFKQVPDAMASFLPRVFDSSDGDEPFITMELLSIPTLGELFVSGRLSLGAWNGVVKNIAYIQQQFSALSSQTALASELARAVYLEKTRSRLSAFLKQRAEASDWWVDVDGRKWDVDGVIATLESFVHERGLLRIATLHPIHGDFCFSNLLYDNKVRLVKMIDPRGEFGVPGIYGDRRYDLAKLAHSYSGGYDFIVTDRFSAAVSQDGSLSLQVHMTDYHARVKSIFESMLLADPGLRREVNAIQALLFLSMLPLHVDAPGRQLAMLARGLQLYAAAHGDGGYP